MEKAITVAVLMVLAGITFVFGIPGLVVLFLLFGQILTLMFLVGAYTDYLDIAPGQNGKWLTGLAGLLLVGLVLALGWSAWRVLA